MSEQLADDTDSPQQLEKEERSRGDGEGEEKIMQQVEEEAALKCDMWQEENKEGPLECPESPVKVESTQAKVQSVFSLVRNQIRSQTSLDTRRTGMLQLVQRVTRQLDRNKGDQLRSVSSFEIPSAEEEVTTALEAEEEATTVLEAEEETTEVKDDQETDDKSKEEMCVVLLQEVLDSLESMRKEVREGLSLLRLESQTNTEQALKSLEARLTNTFSKYMMPQALSGSHLAGAFDGKKHKPLTVPPLIATRRRTLSRTMTTITPKSCPPPSLGQRSMSEPLRGQIAERGTYSYVRGGNPLGPLHAPLGPLPPALPPTQLCKKPLRSKPRGGKAAA